MLEKSFRYVHLSSNSIIWYWPNRADLGRWYCSVGQVTAGLATYHQVYDGSLAGWLVKELAVTPQLLSRMCLPLTASHVHYYCWVCIFCCSLRRDWLCPCLICSINCFVCYCLCLLMPFPLLLLLTNCDLCYCVTTGTAFLHIHSPRHWTLTFDLCRGSTLMLSLRCLVCSFGGSR